MTEYSTNLMLLLHESKPIKGTLPRSKDPVEDVAIAERLRTSVKDRAENLMIVDLVRNDFGRVCRVGTVAVPKLMAIESFETVHQLVSTVTGELAEVSFVFISLQNMTEYFIILMILFNDYYFLSLAKGRDCIDAVRAAFPGGSMTGAPKERTMQIIADLETSVRGAYSGALGFLSIDGSCDLNIVIRSGNF
jgi:para-aminobenzoate synthetase